MNNPFRVLVFFIIKFYKSLSVSLEIVFKLVGFIELFLQASDSIFAISAPFIIFHIPVFKINSISSNSILGEAIVLQIHENVVKLFFFTTISIIGLSVVGNFLLANNSSNLIYRHRSTDLRR